MKRKDCLILYSLTLFILFIVSMYHWIGWNGFSSYIYIGCSIVILYLMNSNSIRKDFSSKNILVCLSFYFTYLIVALNIYDNIISTVWITQIFTFLIPMLGIICLENREKHIVLNNITKMFAGILVPAILLYFVNLVFPIPPLGSIQLCSDSDSVVDGYGIAKFHFFSIESISSVNDSLRRFQGPFLEPGYVGMMSAFLLLANHHNYKKLENIIIAFALILSFSLAGYVLWLYGFISCRFYDGKTSPKLWLSLFVVVALFVIVGFTWNSGDNIIYSTTLSRLEYDPLKGFSGNNRSSLTVDLLFVNMLSDWKILLLGYPKSYLTILDGEPNNGFRFFMVQKGLLQLFLVILPYFLMLKDVPNKKWGTILIIFFFMMFWQRTYPFWFSWVICFDYSMSNSFENCGKRPNIICNTSD